MAVVSLIIAIIVCILNIFLQVSIIYYKMKSKDDQIAKLEDENKGLKSKLKDALNKIVKEEVKEEENE